MGDCLIALDCSDKPDPAIVTGICRGHLFPIHRVQVPSRGIKRNAERESLSNKAMQNYRLVGKLAKNRGTTRAQEVARIEQRLKAEQEAKNADQRIM